MSKFSIKQRIKSFRYAFSGIGILIKNEHNFWIHLVFAILVIGFGIWLNLSGTNWIVLTFAIGFVFMAEGFNTAIEHLANAVSKEENQHIKKAKDVAAGAVLLAAITAAIIGLIVFLPAIIDKLFT